MSRLQRVLDFVRSHSPGEDAYIDDTVTPAVVRWTGLLHDADGKLHPGQCAASTFAEAREELGY